MSALSCQQCLNVLLCEENGEVYTFGKGIQLQQVSDLHCFQEHGRHTEVYHCYRIGVVERQV